MNDDQKIDHCAKRIMGDVYRSTRIFDIENADTIQDWYEVSKKDKEYLKSELGRDPSHEECQALQAKIRDLLSQS